MHKINNIFLLTILMTVMLGASLSARADAPMVKRENQSFEEYRRTLLKDFNDFRSTVLERYADFLNGEWHEYESYRGMKRDNKPKPHSIPEAPSGSQLPLGDVVSVPAGSDVIPVVSETRHPENTISPDDEAFTFMFYGMPMQLPTTTCTMHERLTTGSDYSRQWKTLLKDRVADELLPALKSLVSQLGLNDYLTFQLLNAYINSLYKSADVSARTATVHFLLVNLGYDVRIALTDTGIPVLLIPFNQIIYGRSYMVIDGNKYYLFEPEGTNISSHSKVRTCQLPVNINSGRSMELVLGELNLPMKPRSFEFECGPIKLAGEVNENLMPVLYHYPQMPVADFANSNIQPELRKQLVQQLQTSLKEYSGDEAAGLLLAFMHSVFDYATDEDFHGFEKPYFIEETLYYPKNDCEDRAIFYAWFLWNALGKGAQLVSYPGHEAVTVKLDNPVKGVGYQYQGDTYYISDPTYIGSHTGMIMPNYRDVTPTIDTTFK